MSIVHQPNCGEFDDYDHVNADHHHHHLNEGHLISAPCRSLGWAQKGLLACNEPHDQK